MTRDRTHAYMELLDAIQNYVRVVHSDEHYARDWVLITGIERLRDRKESADIRLDTSPNTSNWSIYGLLAVAIDNFKTQTNED